MSEVHKMLVLRAINSSSKGLRVASLVKHTGLNQAECEAALAGLTREVDQFRQDSGVYLYKTHVEKPCVIGMATSREAIPMHALASYKGEFKRAGAV